MNSAEPFHIAREVNLVDLASLLATVGFGIYLAVYIEKRKTDKRREKDIVIDHIADICLELSNLKRITDAGSFELKVGVQSLKDVRMSYTRLGEMVLFCKLHIKRSRPLELADKLSIVNRAMTDTPLAGTTSKDTNVVAGGVMTLSGKNARILHREYHALITGLRFLQLEINAL